MAGWLVDGLTRGLQCRSLSRLLLNGCLQWLPSVPLFQMSSLWFSPLRSGLESRDVIRHSESEVGKIEEER